MSIKRDNEKLDELICRTINTEKPQFDAEKWKQKYPDEYQKLISRREKAALSRQANIRRVIFGKRAAQIAAAAVIIVAAGLLIIYRNLPVPQWPQQQTASVAKSPVEMLTPISLRNAYLVGGMEAVDEQNRKAFQMLNRKQVKVSIHELHLQIETDGM